MKIRTIISLDKGDVAQFSKVLDAYGLVEGSLRAGERDKGSRNYRLAWLGRIQANEFTMEDVSAFRAFVEDMASRAVATARTLSEFGNPTSTVLVQADGLMFSATRARQLCRSFCDDLDEDRAEYAGDLASTG